MTSTPTASTTTRVRRSQAAACGLLTVVWASASWSATYHVAPKGSGDGSGSKPWGDLQSAVASTSPAQAGDTITVEAGTYTLTAQVDFQKSGSAGSPIRLVAEPGVVLNVTASSTEAGALNLQNVHDWVIDGFRLNDAPHYGISVSGGTNITVQNCYVYRAQASGIIVRVSDWGTDDIYPVPQNWNIQILNSTFEQANWNSNDNEGISLWATDGFEIAGNTLIDCRHEGIDAKTGARNGTIHHNTIRGDYNSYGGTGMGVYIDGWHYDTHHIDVYDNVVYDSEEGFEVQCEDCNKPNTSGSVHDVRFFNNVVYHNTDIQGSGWKGRAMSFFGEPGHPVHDVHVFHNTFVGCQRLGIHVDNAALENLFIRNNIIVGNGSVDVLVDHGSSVVVENNILSTAIGNSVGAELTASNNIVTDPRFVDAAHHDYHLQNGSPAINQASGTDVATSDFDGKPRPIDWVADLGAFEYGTPSGAGGGGAAQTSHAAGVATYGHGGGFREAGVPAGDGGTHGDAMAGGAPIDGATQSGGGSGIDGATQSGGGSGIHGAAQSEGGSGIDGTKGGEPTDPRQNAVDATIDPADASGSDAGTFPGQKGVAANCGCIMVGRHDGGGFSAVLLGLAALVRRRRVIPEARQPRRCRPRSVGAPRRCKS